MDKVINTKEAIKISQTLHEQNKRIVLAGGCFDILHIGHIQFLEKAKNKGEVLMIFLESDESIKKTKGKSRPINTQEDRAKILASLEMVDYVIILEPLLKNTDYDTLIKEIKPDIIATTKGDSNRMHKERQSKLIHGRVVDVTLPIKNQSTTRLIKLFEEL